MEKTKITSREIVTVGLMVAVIEVCKIAFMGLPNIELTSFWIILFALYFGKSIYFAIPVFIVIEGLIFGINLWWIMYLYTWPLLAIVTKLFSNVKSVTFWSVFSGVFGLLFGALNSLVYIFMGDTLSAGLRSAFAWWVSGIPYDLIHGAGNFVIMLILYKPITNIIETYKMKQK